MANKGLSDILTKLANVLKNDMYLVDWRFCLGGKKTEVTNAGTVICVLEEDETEIFKSLYPDNHLVYLEDVKKYKVDPAKYERVNFKEKEIIELQEKRDEYMKIIQKVTAWQEFKFTDGQLINIFEKGGLVGVPVNDKLTLLISKQLFPLMRATNVASLKYSIVKDESERGGFFLVIKHDHPMFMFYNVVYYLSI